MEKNLSLSTIEELVTLAVKEVKYGGGQRYRLDWSDLFEFVDEVAGKAWEKEREQIIGWDAERKIRGAMSYADWRDCAAYRAYLERGDAWDNANPQPAKHIVRYYHLSETGSGRGYFRRHGKTIDLSFELGEQIRKIWKVKDGKAEAHYDRELVGAMTLEGIIKRLGTGAGKDKVAAARAAAEAAEALRIRNVRRDNIRRAVEELEKQIAAAPELELNFPALAELKAQLKEEY